MDIERNRVNPQKIGRDYSIDYMEAVDQCMDFEDAVVSALNPTEEQERKKENISGFIEHMMDWAKGRIPRVNYNDIPTLLETTEVMRSGLVYFYHYKTGFDFVKSGGDILIPKDTEILEVLIPRVDFSKDQKGVVTPRMISRSFDMLAARVYLENKSADYILGLTHPRLGVLAKRLDFNVESRPFPEEVYRLLDLGLEDQERSPADRENLESLKRQVLVYQTREEFLKRITPSEELDKLRELPKAEEITFARFTERRALRWRTDISHSELAEEDIEEGITDKNALTSPDTVALVRQFYLKGKVKLGENVIIPFKTQPKKISTTYKYFPGVRIVDMGGVSNIGISDISENSRYAIVIPTPEGADEPEQMIFLTPKDKVVHCQSGHHIYP